MITNYNDYVGFRAKALAFMGIEPEHPTLAFPFMSAPPPTENKAHCKRRPLTARPAIEQDRSWRGPLFDWKIYVPPADPIPVRAPSIHSPELRPYSMFARRQLTTAERGFKRESDRIQRTTAHLRPSDPPVDCRPGMPGAIRPCPWASCRYNLLVSVNASGSLKVDHGHLDSSLLEESCAIDVAQKHKEGITQEQTAKLTGVTEDRVRQVERGLMRRLRRKARKLRPDLRDGP
jgi:hypothetical protein